MSLPRDPATDDELLGRYLLGMLPETEEEQLDELSVADDDFAARLDSVRHDLIDAYVRGNLTGDRLNGFEGRFLSSPLMRGRIRFAEALRAYRPPAPLVSRATAAIGWRPAAAQWGWAAAAALLIALSGYLTLDNVRLRRLVGQSASEQGSRQDRERELQRQLEQQRAAADDAARELARAREALGQLQARTNGPATGSIVASFLLVPARRGPADLTAITIPVRADTVALRLEPEDGDFARYRVAIRSSADDRILWRSTDLDAVPDTDGTKRVTATLPAALLTPGTYVAELSGVQGRGNTTDSAGSYAFRVIRP